MSTGVGLTIQVRDQHLEAQLARFVAGLEDRSGLHARIGEQGQFLVATHLRALNRHETATGLGATPSGFWERAAHATSFASDDRGAVISIDSPGMARAVRDITITPTAGRKFLTIPVIAEAYNKRAYRVRGLVAIVSGDKGVLMMPQKGTGTTYKTRRYSGPDKFTTHEKTGGRFGTVWFVLVRTVHQKQDRGLLPSDEEFIIATQKGVSIYSDDLFSLQAGRIAG